MRLTLTIFAFLFITPSFSQKSVEILSNNLINKSDYFHNYKIEKFHLHTNKSTYYTGEKIWFKAYIVDDDDNKPCLETVNLHINLFDSDNNLVASNLFYAENGTAHGEFDLTKNLKSGNYKLQLSTQWNKNFKNGTLFNIKVISLNHNNKLVKPINAIDKDSLIMNFFPESKTLLKNQANNIYFSIYNNNLPIAIKGEIIDDQSHKIVCTFKSNEFGVGAINLLYNSTYTAVFFINGIKKTIRLPKAKLNGVILHQKRTPNESKFVIFELKTNNTTVSKLYNESVFAVLHRNGSLKSIAPIKIKKDVNYYRLQFLKDNLFNGFNTITLFNSQNQIISERNFYWNQNQKFDLKITKGKVSQDSVILNINVPKVFKKANLSISVLPDETKLYNNTSNIINSFLLEPYINSNANNIAGLINNIDLKNEALDMLIQTLSKNNEFPYKKLSHSAPKLNTEKGIIIRGSINTKIKDLSNYKVLLSSQENGLLLMNPISNANEFLFDNLILFHPTKYKLALISDKGKIEKASFFIYNSYTGYKPESTLKINHKITGILNKTEALSKEDIGNTISLPKYKNSEDLDEVVILGYKDKLKIKKDRLLSNNPHLIGLKNNFTQHYLIDETVNEALDIVDYLKTLGGIKVLTGNNFGDISITSTRGPKSFNGSNAIPVFLNGLPLGDDLRILNGYSVKDFDLVSINLSGAGFGITGSNGVINLLTKENISGKNGDNLKIKKSDTEFGYSLPSITYENLFLEFQSQSALNYYGVLDWIPNYDVIPNTNNTIKINRANSNNIKIIINGFNENGALFFNETNLSIDK